jgi:hypothetical protein
MIENGAIVPECDQLGRMNYASRSPIGNHDIVLTIADTAGGTLEQAFTLTVGADVEAPKVTTVLSSFDNVDVGTKVTFFASATDNVGVSGLQLRVNGQAVTLDRDGLATLTLTQVGAVTAQAIAMLGKVTANF